MNNYSKTTLLICFAILNFLAAIVLANPANADEIKISLQPQPGSILKCRTQLEFDGDVVVFNADPKAEETSVTLSVKSEQLFDQFQIDPSNALRKYSVASATIQLNGKETSSGLSESNRQIVVRRTKTGFNRPLQYFSNGGALKQSEQELLSTPCDLFALMALVDHGSIEVGKKWTPENRLAQALFSLDNVVENRLSIQLKEVDKNQIAKVYLTGEVAGEVDGCSTSIRISGVALIDLNKSVPKAFRATLTENRQASQLAPGFDGNIKVDISCTVQGARDVNDETIKQVTAKIKEKHTSRLLWNSESEFEMIYDPQWKLILSDSDVVVMRFAEKGNLLAQCNVLSLPRRPENNPLELKEFETQLSKNVIGESGAKITSSTMMTTASGMKVLQVIVSGVEEEIPMSWIYYHVSETNGRCVAVVLTIEDEALESFGNADVKLLDSIRFVPKDRKASNPPKTVR